MSKVNSRTVNLKKPKQNGNNLKSGLPQVNKIIEKVSAELENVVGTSGKLIRQNLEQVISKIQNVKFVEIAKNRAKSTGKSFLESLHIPSQRDISQLSKKINSLEKKIETLAK